MALGSAPVVTIESPKPDEKISTTTLTVSGTILDPDNDASYVEITVGTIKKTQYVTNSFEQDFDIGSFEAKKCTVTVVAYDKNKNTSQATVSFTLTKIPQLTIDYVYGMTESSTGDEYIIFEGTLIDDNTNTFYMWVIGPSGENANDYFADSWYVYDPTTDTIVFFGFQLDLNFPYPIGDYTFYMCVEDDDGNESDYWSIELNYDGSQWSYEGEPIDWY